MSIELWTWNTPNGRKISVALEEMGLPYTVKPVNISQGRAVQARVPEDQPEQPHPGDRRSRRPGRRADQHLRIRRDPDLSRREDRQILAAGDLRRQVPVLEWLMWQMGGFGPMPGQVHHFLQVANEQDRRYGLERYMKETRRLYGVFDKRLGEVPFAGGSEVSIADFAILGWAWRHERHQVDLADYPNVKRWYETMMARPGIKRGFEVALS